MKAIHMTIITAISLLFLGGCVNMGIDYKDYCWESCKKTKQCGKCILHHCEKICSECHGTGPACIPCWECLKHDVCMY